MKPGMDHVAVDFPDAAGIADRLELRLVTAPFWFFTTASPTPKKIGGLHFRAGRGLNRDIPGLLERLDTETLKPLVGVQRSVLRGPPAANRGPSACLRRTVARWGSATYAMAQGFSLLIPRTLSLLA